MTTCNKSVNCKIFSNDILFLKYSSCWDLDPLLYVCDTQTI